MSEKVILTCTECLSRNYTTQKNKTTHTDRIELKKYCKKCGKHTIHKETKQEVTDMMKWFSISGIMKEIKRIRWSSPKKLAEDSGKVILFTCLFALFFVLCTAFNAAFLSLLGV